MWQSKREISRECNDIIGSAKGSQINEKYWGEVGKGKRVDVYLEVRKRRGHIFFEWNKCLCRTSLIRHDLNLTLGCHRFYYLAPLPVIDSIYLALVQDKKITCVLPANACCTVYVNCPQFSMLFLFKINNSLYISFQSFINTQILTISHIIT